MAAASAPGVPVQQALLDPMVFPPGGNPIDPSMQGLTDPATLGGPMPTQGGMVDTSMQGPMDPTKPGGPTATLAQAPMDPALVNGGMNPAAPGMAPPPDAQAMLIDSSLAKDSPYGDIGEEEILNLTKEEHVEHESTRSMIQGIGYVSLLLNIVSAALPMWKMNGVVVIGYDYERTWGLWSVMGQKHRLHHEVAGRACDNYSMMNADGICSTPICLWYQKKCEMFVDFMVLSYSCGGVIVFGILLHMAACMWTSKGASAKSIQWAAACWPIAFFCSLAGITTWMCLTNMIFVKLNEDFVYPVPGLGAAFFLACAAGLGQLVNCFLIRSLLGKLAPDDEDDMYDYEAEESDASDGLVGELVKGAAGDLVGDLVLDAAEGLLQPKTQPPQTREELLADVFKMLDTQDGRGDGKLTSECMLHYARMCGFEGKDEDWHNDEFPAACEVLNVDPKVGLTLADFSKFCTDDSSSGYVTTEQLINMWTNLSDEANARVR